MAKEILERSGAVAGTPGHSITLYNCGKQLIVIQVKPPGGDFFLSEQQIQLTPGKTVTLPKNYIRIEQIDNLCAKKFLKIVHDSEKD